MDTTAKQYSYRQSPREEERKKGTENLFNKIMDRNFLNLGGDLDSQIHEANRSPPNFNPK